METLGGTMSYNHPQKGEIWKDADGQHSLILDTFSDDGEDFAHVYCMDTGTEWSHEPFGYWYNPQKDGLPYYRYLVG